MQVPGSHPSGHCPLQQGTQPRPLPTQPARPPQAALCQQQPSPQAAAVMQQFGKRLSAQDTWGRPYGSQPLCWLGGAAQSSTKLSLQPWPRLPWQPLPCAQQALPSGQPAVWPGQGGKGGGAYPWFARVADPRLAQHNPRCVAGWTQSANGSTKCVQPAVSIRHCWLPGLSRCPDQWGQHRACSAAVLRKAELRPNSQDTSNALWALISLGCRKGSQQDITPLLASMVQYT